MDLSLIEQALLYFEKDGTVECYCKECHVDIDQLVASITSQKTQLKPSTLMVKMLVSIAIEYAPKEEAVYLAINMSADWIVDRWERLHHNCICESLCELSFFSSLLDCDRIREMDINELLLFCFRNGEFPKNLQLKPLCNNAILILMNECLERDLPVKARLLLAQATGSSNVLTYLYKRLLILENKFDPNEIECSDGFEKFDLMVAAGSTLIDFSVLLSQKSYIDSLKPFEKELIELFLRTIDTGVSVDLLDENFCIHKKRMIAIGARVSVAKQSPDTCLSAIKMYEKCRPKLHEPLVLEAFVHLAKIKADPLSMQQNLATLEIAEQFLSTALAFNSYALNARRGLERVKSLKLKCLEAESNVAADDDDDFWIDFEEEIDQHLYLEQTAEQYLQTSSTHRLQVLKTLFEHKKKCEYCQFRYMRELKSMNELEKCVELCAELGNQTHLQKYMSSDCLYEQAVSHVNIDIETTVKLLDRADRLLEGEVRPEDLYLRTIILTVLNRITVNKYAQRLYECVSLIKLTSEIASDRRSIILMSAVHAKILLNDLTSAQLFCLAVLQEDEEMNIDAWRSMIIIEGSRKEPCYRLILYCLKRLSNCGEKSDAAYLAYTYLSKCPCKMEPSFDAIKTDLLECMGTEKAIVEAIENTGCMSCLERCNLIDQVIINHREAADAHHLLYPFKAMKSVIQFESLLPKFRNYLKKIVRCEKIEKCALMNEATENLESYHITMNGSEKCAFVLAMLYEMKGNLEKALHIYRSASCSLSQSILSRLRILLRQRRHAEFKALCTQCIQCFQPIPAIWLMSIVGLYKFRDRSGLMNILVHMNNAYFS